MIKLTKWKISARFSVDSTYKQLLLSGQMPAPSTHIFLKLPRWCLTKWRFFFSVSACISLSYFRFHQIANILFQHFKIFHLQQWFVFLAFRYLGTCSVHTFLTSIGSTAGCISSRVQSISMLFSRKKNSIKIWYLNRKIGLRLSGKYDTEIDSLTRWRRCRYNL